MSQVDFESRGYPPPAEGEPPSPDTLDETVGEAEDYIEAVTGRTYATMPTILERIARAATRLRTEQVVMQNQDDAVEPTGDWELISAFTAGSYSETRRDPYAKSGGAGPTAGWPTINPWPALNQRLWQLLTQIPGAYDPNVAAMAEYWLALMSGVMPPAWGYDETSWTATRVVSDWRRLTAAAAAMSGGSASGVVSPWSVY